MCDFIAFFPSQLKCSVVLNICSGASDQFLKWLTGFFCWQILCIPIIREGVDKTETVQFNSNDWAKTPHWYVSVCCPIITKIRMNKCDRDCDDGDAKRKETH